LMVGILHDDGFKTINNTVNECIKILNGLITYFENSDLK
jgi:hypothetical protein